MNNELPNGLASLAVIIDGITPRRLVMIGEDLRSI
jgi:hypothetical protein